MCSVRKCSSYDGSILRCVPSIIVNIVRFGARCVLKEGHLSQDSLVHCESYVFPASSTASHVAWHLTSGFILKDIDVLDYVQEYGKRTA